ncbi:MAG TPA: hypothetical protein VML56_01610, partial [Burkholderiales bacterium]|nr:hypothetical protein [Burkholderiales bacterium]
VWAVAAALAAVAAEFFIRLAWVASAAASVVVAAVDFRAVVAASVAVARRVDGSYGSRAYLPAPVHDGVERAPRVSRVVASRH